ncbi:MAG: uncharacterized protein KVP18_001902 [Porospora cf. gigantea A]|uniref:uncharacterized protein n=1 Tax=Porospora cf. gigantea A TaxID=2853593 RepID=UPI003559A3AC|nr:MAG: hypothetical protein KVP18_001902 [Porospora cf. gigantea A]
MQSLTRASLHHADIEHTVAPTIEFIPDEKSAAISYIKLESLTENAVCYCRINKNQWQGYDKARMPYLTGPGEYHIECFAQAHGCFPSTVNMRSVTLPAPEAEAAPDAEAAPGAQDAVPAAAPEPEEKRSRKSAAR